MHRVELKDTSKFVIEVFSILFLMHRVELKVQYLVSLNLFEFLMHRVELKVAISPT
jgi:hypothetical protein